MNILYCGAGVVLNIVVKPFTYCTYVFTIGSLGKGAYQIG